MTSINPSYGIGSAVHISSVGTAPTGRLPPAKAFDFESPKVDVSSLTVLLHAQADITVRHTNGGASGHSQHWTDAQYTLMFKSTTIVVSYKDDLITNIRITHSGKDESRSNSKDLSAGMLEQKSCYTLLSTVKTMYQQSRRAEAIALQSNFEELVKIIAQAAE